MEYLLWLLLLVAGLSLFQKLNVAIGKIELLRRELDELKKTLAEDAPSCPPVPSQPAVMNREEPVVSAQVPEETPPPVPAGLRQSPSVPPPVPRQPRPFTPESPGRPVFDYEKFIGENLFGKIGILVLVVGVGLFVKYAIDNEWIGEVARTTLGFLAGAALLGIGFFLRKSYRAFSSLLSGGGFAVFYVTVAMAYHYYALFSRPSAFALLVFLTLLMSLLALWYDRRELASVALVGGFVAPFLVSEGMGDLLVLFTYLTILNTGMFSLSFYKRWGELPVFCLLLTWYLVGVSLYTVGFADWPVSRLSGLLGFLVAYYLMFQYSVLLVLRMEHRWTDWALLGMPVLNSLFFFGAAHEVMLSLGGLSAYPFLPPLFTALVNGGLYAYFYRRGPSYRWLRQVLLGLIALALVGLVPLQFGEAFITFCWATEMLFAVWLYVRSGNRLFYAVAWLLLVGTFLSCAGDWLTADPTAPAFRNGRFLTSLYVVLAAALSGYGLYRRGETLYRWFLGSAWVLAYLVSVVESCFLFPGENEQFGAVSFLTVAYLAVWTGLSERFPWLSGRYGSWNLYGPVIPTGLFLLDALFLALDQTVSVTAQFCFWLTAGTLVAYLAFEWRIFCRRCDYRAKSAMLPTVFVSALAVVLWLAVIDRILRQAGFTYETSAGWSVSLAVAAFVQMALGMRLHWRSMRWVSLGTFALVLLKLLAVDLWLLPTVGKVAVFLVLGVALLVLSFLYQKLKKSLFGGE